MNDLYINTEGSKEMKIRSIEWHSLKTHKKEFSMTMFGAKNFEFRKNDRGFKVGDYLTLLEWDPEKEEYTGRSCSRQIVYILESKFGVPDGYVVMATRPA